MLPDLFGSRCLLICVILGPRSLKQCSALHDAIIQIPCSSWVDLFLWVNSHIWYLQAWLAPKHSALEERPLGQKHMSVGPTLFSGPRSQKWQGLVRGHLCGESSCCWSVQLHCDILISPASAWQAKKIFPKSFWLVLDGIIRWNIMTAPIVVLGGVFGAIATSNLIKEV